MIPLPRARRRILWRLLRTAGPLSVFLGLLTLIGCGEQQSQTPATLTPAATQPSAIATPATAAAPTFYPPTATETSTAPAWTGRLVRYQPNLVLLTVRGTPEERGAAHGTLLKPEIQRLLVALHAEVEHGQADPQAHFATLLTGARKMKTYLEPAVQAELTACAAAADVPVDELLLVQLFGDINRAEGFTTLCSCYAAFGPATADGNLQFGRNLDYPIRNLDKLLPMILQEIPTAAPVNPATAANPTPTAPAANEPSRPFITVGFAGVISGWTAMNADGLCVENNTLFHGVDSVEGLATCFMLRKLAEHAATVEAAEKILATTPRACTTAMLVAGRNQAGDWDARLFEFDHETLTTQLPAKGLLWETNTCQKLPTAGNTPSGEPACSRYQTLKKQLTALYGKLDFNNDTHNLAAQRGVYLSINLHCAWLDPAHQQLKLAVALDPAAPQRPAAENQFHRFKITPTAIEPQ